MDVISLDPGLRACGVAHFRDGVLVRAALVRGVSDVGDALAWVPLVNNVSSWIFAKGHLEFTFVVEYQQVYAATPGSRVKGGDPNDLLQLASVVGGLCCTLKYQGVRIYRPREWKGNVNADIMTARIEKRLSPAELGAIEKCPASLRHNVIDGIGIGLKYLGRL